MFDKVILAGMIPKRKKNDSLGMTAEVKFER